MIKFRFAGYKKTKPIKLVLSSVEWSQMPGFCRKLEALYREYDNKTKGGDQQLPAPNSGF